MPILLVKIPSFYLTMKVLKAFCLYSSWHAELLFFYKFKKSKGKQQWWEKSILFQLMFCQYLVVIILQTLIETIYQLILQLPYIEELE